MLNRCDITIPVRINKGFKRAYLALAFVALTTVLGCGSQPLSEGNGPVAAPPNSNNFGSGEASSDDVVLPAGIVTNPQPSLSFSATKVFCCDPLSVVFSVHQAGLMAYPSSTYGWHFGDGRTGQGSSVLHTYARPGEYVVVLEVTSGDRVLETASQAFTVTTDFEIISANPNDSPSPPVDGVPGDGNPDDSEPDDPVGPDDGSDDSSSPPTLIANAGQDQTVTFGSLVRLDGSQSRYTGPNTVTAEWHELTASGVSLHASDTLSPYFAAPTDPTGPAHLVFELVVRAGRLRASDIVTVHLVTQTVDLPGGDGAGGPVQFLSGPGRVAPSGSAEVTWRFAPGRVVSNVTLRQDCCNCPDQVSPVLSADSNGVYHANVSVPETGTIWYHVLYTWNGVEYQSRSIHVNPPAGSPAGEPPPIIWYHYAGLDTRILVDVIRSGAVTHVLLSGGDRPTFSATDRSVLASVALCRHAGLQVIWGRHLWNNFIDFDSEVDVFDPAFYIGVLDEINDEAELIGADLTAIDCEVYVGSPLYDFLKADLSETDFAEARTAIEQAAAQRRADFVYPVGTHGRPMRIDSLYGALGVKRISTSTFADMPHKNCRIEGSYDVFGAWVQPTTERPAYGLNPFFLPLDILDRRYHWSAADGAPVDVNGLFLYPGSEDESQTALTATILAQAAP